ncbi:WD40 repeat [Streptomyces sp. Ncost-T6T-1]|uniref:WD40 repeat domain-containing protein n=1 Tax=Streptomyces sp. Ncost-T6T-1 TaxID=1100828 RepID=UPI000805D361|nr:WD40 repeat domain-containing protein [Streptomyces sp. Ncost-T6T-1]SBV01427.1 WD40 repeat [Streptomyces sp. Ncost-T6T-1]
MTPGEGASLPAELAGPSASFIGRAWALAEVASWYATADPLLVISAAPGVGKSALAVRLAQLSLGEVSPAQGLEPGWLHAWHFCQAQRFGSLNIRSVLERIAVQLCTTIPGYAEAVARHEPGTTIVVNQQFTGPVQNSTVTAINQLVLPDAEPRQLLDSMLRRPLSELGTTAVVLLDALDETEEHIGGPQTLAALLSTLRSDPVPGLRLVLTTRTGPTAELFTHGQQLRLQHDEPAGTHDVYAYLRQRLHDRGIADPPHLAQSIAQAADGNFLYAALVASESAENLRLHASGEHVLPRGLAGLYSSFLERRVTADPRQWREAIRPVLGLLAQSRGNGFTRRQLARLSGLRQSAVDDALEVCAPYLRGSHPDGPFLPFHGSLRDHLRSVSRNGVYAQESTEQIIRALRDDVTDPHSAEHLLGYLTDRIHFTALDPADGHDRREPHGLDELDETVTDGRYLGARVSLTGVDPLLSEVTALHNLFPDRPVLAAVRGVLGRQAHNLRGTDEGRAPSFSVQQLLYECSVSGHPGLIRTRGTGNASGFEPSWSSVSGNSRLLSHTLATSEFSVKAVAMSSDGSVTAAYGTTWQGQDLHVTVRVFDTESGSTIRELPTDELTVPVWDLSFSADDRSLVALGGEHLATAWDLASGAVAAVKPGEDVELPYPSRPAALPPYVFFEQGGSVDPSEVTSAITPDLRYAAVCAHSESVTVWDLSHRTNLGRYEAELVTSLAISPDGRWVVVGSALGGTHVLSPLSSAPQFPLDGHRGSVKAASLRGGLAATLGYDGSLKVWDVDTGRLMRTTGTPPLPVGGEALALGDEAHLCAVGTSGGSAALLDLRVPSLVRTLLVGGHPCDENWQARAGARDEALPPVGSGDCPRDHWLERVNHRHGSPVSALDISPDGRRIVTGTLNGVVRVWDTATGDLVREVTRGGHLVKAARFTPDGAHLITAAQLGGLFVPRWEGVEVWSMSTGEMTSVLWPDPAGPFFPLPDDDSIAALSDDGRYLATGHRNGTVTVNDLIAGESIGTLMLHGSVTCLALDGRRLLAGTANGDVTLARMPSASPPRDQAADGERPRP